LTFCTYIAANTFRGFSSYFDELIRNEQNKQVYLIKGGPGCGKNTLMKKISDHFDVKGYTIENIYCSSDPKSLDGVSIKEANTVIIDATPPHSFDMKYPGIIDNIIDMSRFWDNSVLTKNKNEIKYLFNDISNRYNSVYSILRSAGILLINQQIESENNCDKAKIISFIKKFIKQSTFDHNENDSRLFNRYLSSISCNGIATHKNTIETLCTRGIVITDEISLSSYIISKFISYFKKTGNDIYIFHNPLCPEQKIDHIIIPGLKLGIFTNNYMLNLNFENQKFKNINTKAFINKDYYSDNKNKINLKRKIISQLLDTSTNELKIVKKLHDELEEYYKASMNYHALDNYTNDIISHLDKNIF